MGEIAWNWTRYVLGLLVMFIGVVVPILYMMLKFNNSTRKYSGKKYGDLGSNGSSGLKPPLLSPISLSPAVPPHSSSTISTNGMASSSSNGLSSSLIQPIPLTPLQSEKESFD